MVVELPRLPGSRENRWMHLLGGQPAIDSVPGGSKSSAASGSEIDELRIRVTALEAEVAELRKLLLGDAEQ